MNYFRFIHSNFTLLKKAHYTQVFCRTTDTLLNVEQKEEDNFRYKRVEMIDVLYKYSLLGISTEEVTATLSGVITHTSAEPKLITVIVDAQTANTAVNDEGTVASDQAKSISAIIDGTTYTEDGSGDNSAQFTTFPFTTEFVYSGTTLELTYSSRETVFTFDGSVSTEITIPSSHTHVTVNGVETAIDLPGLTTIIDVSESTTVAVTLSEVTTTMVVTAETYALTITADTIHVVDDNTYCGFNTDAAQTLAGGAKESLCIPALSTVITLPTGAQALYLNAPGVTTVLGISASTATFTPTQGREIHKRYRQVFCVSLSKYEYA